MLSVFLFFIGTASSGRREEDREASEAELKNKHGDPSLCQQTVAREGSKCPCLSASGLQHYIGASNVAQSSTQYASFSC